MAQDLNNHCYILCNVCCNELQPAFHLHVPSLGMKQVNAVLITLVLAEVSVQIGKSSDSMTKQGEVLKQNDAGQTKQSL